MTDAIANTISSSLNATTMWTEVGHVLPIVIPLVVFSFGFYLMRRVINTSRTGKTRT